MDEALDTVRASVHDLHDERIDLAAQIAQIARESGLAVACTVEADAAPPQVAACLSAVAREALSNVARHSSAASVTLALTEYPGFWQLIVENDGVPAGSCGTAGDGAASDRAVPRVATGGMGLVSLEERVRALGGTFRAGASVSGTWRVFASIPKQHEGEAS